MFNSSVLDIAVGLIFTFLAVSLTVSAIVEAIATLFGAPFWFDALERIVRLKGSGPSPEEKKRAGTGAAV
jgi:hypothetical protein